MSKEFKKEDNDILSVDAKISADNKSEITAPAPVAKIDVTAKPPSYKVPEKIGGKPAVPVRAKSNQAPATGLSSWDRKYQMMYTDLRLNRGRKGFATYADFALACGVDPAYSLGKPDEFVKGFIAYLNWAVTNPTHRLTETQKTQINGTIATLENAFKK